MPHPYSTSNVQPTKPEKPQPSPLPWKAFDNAGSNMQSYQQSSGIVSADNTQLICGCFHNLKGGEETASVNAQLICMAVNHHQELVEALRYLANDVLQHFPALKEPQTTCMGLAASYQNARAVLAQVETQK